MLRTSIRHHHALSLLSAPTVSVCSHCLFCSDSCVLQKLAHTEQTAAMRESTLKGEHSMELQQLVPSHLLLLSLPALSAYVMLLCV